ncbi:hypothetical protein L1987_01061 [Smallanthus sonchifolius]|uniref:Uncharacterized protein n=1 Tax=Smallanthus sonchifolius TaxID=185202 RepID=A0ACB9K495_9ASTR|nr:hypothetical protein L1987_01061 [Smallanthus sonchifolius]
MATELGEYVPLCRAIETGDWEKAQELFNEDKDALTDKLNFYGNTPLHIAIGNPENTMFLENLLEQINPESLPTLVNNSQQNALHFAAVLDNTIAAKKLVQKNPYLLFAIDDQKYLPIQAAINNSHKTTFLYLLQVCKQHIGLSQKEGYYNPFEGKMGANLLSCTIMAGFLDVAYDLLQDYPQLARTKGIKTPLWSMARMRDAYPNVPIKNYGVDHTYKIKDIENHETYATNLLTECTKSYVYPELNVVSCVVIKKIYVKFWEVALLHVPHIKNLHEDKVKHNIALMILKFICMEIGKLKSNHFEHYGDAYIQAVVDDSPEVIEQIIRIFPESIWTDNNGYTLSQLSIIYRCEKVYNFWVHKLPLLYDLISSTYGSGIFGKRSERRITS